MTIAKTEPMGSELVIRGEQSTFSPAQRAALAHMGVDKAPDADVNVFFHVCQRTRLDPFARQIYMIGRPASEQDENGRWVKKTKYTIQTGIDGFRVVARRVADETGAELSYGDTVWCGRDGVWRDVWTGEPDELHAAKATVLRAGKPFTHVAIFREYVQTKTNGEPNSMWASKGANQLAKCFDSETEVLTNQGFRRFADVGEATVLQVTSRGVEPAPGVQPFRQEYAGPMVAHHKDMLDFSVTPNHDMVTTVGKVEAGAMLATSRHRTTWRIPMVMTGACPESGMVSDEDIRLAAVVVADGTGGKRGQEFAVAVSRPAKVAAVRSLSPASEYVQHCAGQAVVTKTRTIRTNFDKDVFTFPLDRVSALVDIDKTIAVDAMLSLSPRQIRVFMDAWIEFDGHANRKTGVRRLYTSRVDHLRAAEVLAVAAGYSVNNPRPRTSDISDRPNYALTISEPKAQPVLLSLGSKNPRPGVYEEPTNPSGEVWCVTVPSGVIVTRRRGFSMLCGNCAEAGALRKAYPQDLGGLYVDAEVEHLANEAAAGQVVSGGRDWYSDAAAATTVQQLADVWSAAHRAHQLDEQLMTHIRTLRADIDAQMAAPAEHAPTERIDQATGEVLDAEVVTDAPAPSAPLVKRATASSIVRELVRCGVAAESVDAYLPALGIPRKLAELTQDEAVELLDLCRTLDRDKLATLVADAAGSSGA